MEPPVIDLEPLKKPHWSPEEMGHVELVVGFVQTLMNDHDFEAVIERYDNSAYTQHNRNIPDGVEGLVGLLRDFTRRYPEYSYDVRQVLADGDRVVFHSHATLRRADRGNDKKGMNITDHWKVRDGQIVEHWDSIQPIDWMMRLYVLLNGGKIRNANGVF